MKFNMPMAVFGGLALIAAAIAVPQITKIQLIPEANAELSSIDLSIISNGMSEIAGAMYGISACRN